MHTVMPSWEPASSSVSSEELRRAASVPTLTLLRQNVRYCRAEWVFPPPMT